MEAEIEVKAVFPPSTQLGYLLTLVFALSFLTRVSMRWIVSDLHQWITQIQSAGVCGATSVPAFYFLI